MATALGFERALTLERSTGSSAPLFVCAWCSAPIPGRRRPHVETPNFGICPPCLQKQLDALPPRSS